MSETLYTRLGETDGIRAIVEDVMAAHLRNPHVKTRYEAIDDIEHAKKMAAEFFAAALIENQRALAVGRRTLGKGVTQRVVELADGSALIVTDGEIRTPTGLVVQGVGVEPHVPIQGGPVNLDTCLSALELVLEYGKNPSNSVNATGGVAE